MGGVQLRDTRRDQLDSLINAYGLFWSLDQATWKGNQMIGVQRMGAGPQMNFWSYPGFYVLYQGKEAVYFGIARVGLGKRIRDHTKDHLKGQWDNFSWFGYGDLADGRRSQPQPRTSAWGGQVLWKAAIFDLEAAIIRALSPRLNVGHGSFRLGKIRWDQYTEAC